MEGGNGGVLEWGEAFAVLAQRLSFFAYSFHLGCGGGRKICRRSSRRPCKSPSRARVSFHLLSTISLPPRSSRLGFLVCGESRDRLPETGALVGARLQGVQAGFLPVSAQGWVGMLQSSAIAWAGKVADPPVLGQGAMFAWRTGRSVCLARQLPDFVFICKDFGAKCVGRRDGNCAGGAPWFSSPHPHVIGAR